MASRQSRKVRLGHLCDNRILQCDHRGRAPRFGIDQSHFTDVIPRTATRDLSPVNANREHTREDQIKVVVGRVLRYQRRASRTFVNLDDLG